MSAIQRDREIAAKATAGVWQYTDFGAIVAGPPHYHPVNPTNYTDTVMWHQGGGLDREEDGAHIVRLRNRQPKYDALVDAVREWIDHPHMTDPGSLVVQRVVGALAALDSEEQ